MSVRPRPARLACASTVTQVSLNGQGCVRHDCRVRLLALPAARLVARQPHARGVATPAARSRPGSALETRSQPGRRPPASLGSARSIERTPWLSLGPPSGGEILVGFAKQSWPRSRAVAKHEAAPTPRASRCARVGGARVRPLARRRASVAAIGASRDDQQRPEQRQQYQPHHYDVRQPAQRRQATGRLLIGQRGCTGLASAAGSLSREASVSPTLPAAAALDDQTAARRGAERRAAELSHRGTRDTGGESDATAAP